MGYRRLDELGNKLEKFCCRVLKEDCLDLPDKIYTRRNVPLTEEQAKAYRQMKELALVHLDNGESSDDRQYFDANYAVTTDYLWVPEAG
jgi:SNF2 family DNA or RNA helicase